MSSGIEWISDPVSVWMPRYQAWMNNIILAIDTTLLARQAEIEAWMKANHVWRNRTTLAETNLFAIVVRDALIITMVMGQGSSVYYSRFLERFMQPIGAGRGRFSVLGPALDYWGPELLNDIRAILS